MLENEARLLAKWLGEIPAAELSPLVNLGSSTAQFRNAVQPWIGRLLVAPLERAGVQIVHVDVKAAEGVDIAGDVFDPEIRALIRARKPKAVMCCNMFEHVPDTYALAACVDSLLPPGGLLLVTAPRSYPFHPDPIDTMCRPSPEELARLFPGFEVLRTAVLPGSTWLGALSRGRTPLGTARALARELGMGMIIWRRGLLVWKAHCHRFLWAFRRYKVSVVMLRKASAGEVTKA